MIIVIAILTLLTATQLSASTISIPDDYVTIQAGINAANNKDTIRVAPGEYFENLQIKGKGITLISYFSNNMDYRYIEETILNGNHTKSVIIIESNGEYNTDIIGFTIKNGSGTSHEQFPGLIYGGGIYIKQKSRLNLEYSIIKENSAAYGSGIFLGAYSYLTLNNVKIENNHNDGVSCGENSFTNLSNVIISGNETYGLRCSPDSKLKADNVVIADNKTTAIYCYGSNIKLSNSIIWNNISGSFEFVEASYRASITISYSDIQGGKENILPFPTDTLKWLDGNINIEPLFENENYLLSDNSSCIDAGNPDLLCYDSCIPPGKGTQRNDMGAYGGPFNCMDISVKAEFTYEVNYGDAPLQVSFTDLSSSINTNIKSWYWNFGDGTTSSEQSPVHSYSEGGIYSVSLKIKGAEGDEDTEIKDSIIFVKGNRFIIVPKDYPTIQSAIDYVSFGDTILVEPGLYVENIDFKGKNIVLCSRFMLTGDTSYISKTVIKSLTYKSVVVFKSHEDSTTVLSGFKIINYRLPIDGSGIFIKDSSPLLCNLIITGVNYPYPYLNKPTEYGGSGGGIYLRNSHSTISNVYISNEIVQDGGGISISESNINLDKLFIKNNEVMGGGAGNSGSGAGIEITYSIVNFKNCEISNNNIVSGYYYGGGIYSYSSTISFEKCFITSNNYDNKIVLGSGLCSRDSYVRFLNVTCANNKTFYRSDFDDNGSIYLSNSKLELINSILWNSNPREIFYSDNQSGSTTVITHSNIRGGLDSVKTNNYGSVFWLEGNINDNPLFTDTIDFHLTQNSPCIDAAIQNSALLYNNNLDTVYIPIIDFTGKAPDMGAYEFSVIAGSISMATSPNSFLLSQNYPNPFNPITKIKYTIPIVERNAVSLTQLIIYDILGNKIVTLINKVQSPGEYEVEFDGSKLSSGIYFYVLNIGENILTRKMCLIK